MADPVPTLAESRAQQICARIDASLAGSGLTFALVLFKPGRAADPASVSLSAHPSHQLEAPLAVRTAALAFENMSRYLDEPSWTTWAGGDCPCPGAVLAEVRRRDGWSFHSHPARLDWSNAGAASDIIAFRVVIP